MLGSVVQVHLRPPTIFRAAELTIVKNESNFGHLRKRFDRTDVTSWPNHDAVHSGSLP